MQLDERDEMRLKDMLAFSRDAIALLGTMNSEEMEANLAVKLALTRCIEIIGEAGHHVSPATQAVMSTIPWHMMYGMRNRLIHDYGNTDYDMVFKVVHEELPGLLANIATFLAQQGHTP